MTERGSKKSRMPVVLVNLGTFSARSKWFPVASRMVTMDETWLHNCDPETRQQSMEWQHSGSPRPKMFRVQKSTGRVLASIFWDQDGILLIDYLPRGQTINGEYYLSLLVQLKDFWRKNAAGSSPGGSYSCTTMSRLTRHLQPRRNCPTRDSNFLLNHPIFRIWPHRTTICSLERKIKFKFRHFSSEAEVIVAAETWLDG